MIRYLKRKYNDLTRDDLIKLRRLTLRGDGYDSGFKEMMDGLWGDLDKTRVVIAKDTDTGKYVGWSAGQYLRKGQVDVGVFVSHKYRRRGIGTKLIKKLVEAMEAREAKCFMFDDVSRGFYSNTFGAWKVRHRDSRGWEGPSKFAVSS